MPSAEKSPCRESDAPMVIGADVVDAVAELLPEALADGDVLVLVLLLLLLVQAARAPTESATALRAMAFLENQGRVDLNARFLLPY
jgi:RecA/RadA recombinase